MNTSQGSSAARVWHFASEELKKEIERNVEDFHFLLNVHTYLHECTKKRTSDSDYSDYSDYWIVEISSAFFQPGPGCNHGSGSLGWPRDLSFSGPPISGQGCCRGGQIL